MNRHLLTGLAVFGLLAFAGVGTVSALATLERHAALASGAGAPAPTVCLDASAPGGDACAAALGDPTWGSLLGLPVAAWAFAAHALVVVLAWLLVAALVARRRRGLLVGATTTAIFALAVVLLGGTAAYLVIGLGVLGVACPLCLTLHGLAAGVGAAALTALILWRADARATLRHPLGWLGLAATVAAFVGLAWFASLWTAAAARDGARAAPHAAADHAAAAFDDALARVCAPNTCPAAALAPANAAPTDHASVVLAAAPAGAPTLLALVDLGCAACRADHAAMAPLYRDLVRTGRAGLRLVLWPHDGACNPHVPVLGKDPTGSCSAGAALVCAARHGGADAALSYIDWELDAASGYLTPGDRARWLALNVDRLASRCLEAEAAMGSRGTLGAHADAAADLRDRLARATPTCASGGAASGAWWCFDATPSFVVARATPVAATSAPDALPRGATGAVRRALLDRCLEP